MLALALLLVSCGKRESILRLFEQSLSVASLFPQLTSSRAKTSIDVFTKQDMHMVGIKLGNIVLIHEHFHPTDAGQYERVICVILAIVLCNSWSTTYFNEEWQWLTDTTSSNPLLCHLLIIKTAHCPLQ